MKIKRFNQLNESMSQDKIKDFYDKVVKIIDYDDDDYEQGDEPSNVDLLSEVGDLMDELNLSTQDLKDIVNLYPNDFYINTYVRGQLEYELKELEKGNKFDDYIKQTLNQYGINITDNTIKAVKEIIVQSKNKK